MSLVATSTIVQKETIVVETPMQVDFSKEHGGSSPTQASSGQPPPPPPLPSGSMLQRLPATLPNTTAARQVASEGEQSYELAADANISEKADSVNEEAAADDGESEDQLCVCAPAQKVPRPPNCECQWSTLFALPLRLFPFTLTKSSKRLPYPA
jgi:hypothetical protein